MCRGTAPGKVVGLGVLYEMYVVLKHCARVVRLAKVSDNSGSRRVLQSTMYVLLHMHASAVPQ